MVEKYHQELEDLKFEVLEFAEFSLQMLNDATLALRERDIAIAGDVDGRKKELAAWSNGIEEKSMRLVALYQPMGEDLRTILCINQVNYSMFRIGRMAKDIAKLVTYLGDVPAPENLRNIFHMADLAVEMLRDALKAFRTKDLSSVQQFSNRDDVVDGMRSSIFRECLTYMMQDNRNIAVCIDYISIARHLERCGDHACLIAEKTYFMVTGKRLEIN